MRPSVALAVALAVLALASAAATLPSATSNAPAAPDGSAPDGPSNGSLDRDADSSVPGPPGDGTDGCFVGCGSGLGFFDRLPTLPAPGPGVLALLAAAALGGLSVLAYRAAGDEGAATPAPDRDEERAGPQPGAAGRRPSGPADAAADNAVYRAWLDLVDGLAVPRVDARTPAEVAAAAVDAGADAAAVRELRELFVAVRYGGRRPTGDREERARAARRRASGSGDDTGQSFDSDESAAEADDGGPDG